MECRISYYRLPPKATLSNNLVLDSVCSRLCPKVHPQTTELESRYRQLTFYLIVSTITVQLLVVFHDLATYMTINFSRKFELFEFSWAPPVKKISHYFRTYVSIVAHHLRTYALRIRRRLSVQRYLFHTSRKYV